MIAVLDIGGTSIKYGVLQSVADSCRFLCQGETDSNARLLQGPGIVEKAARIIESLMQKYELQGVAISTAGMVDAERGVILYANENIPLYTNMKLKKIFEGRFHIPCWVENDVNSAALGESCYGAGKNADSMLMLTIGTGIGGAVVLHGDVYHGHSNSAGEIGYLWVDGQHFQDIASTTALVRAVEKKSGQTGLNGKIIFEQAKQGNELCQNEIRSMCGTIVKGISSCVCLLNPQVVVLGGGIMIQREYLAPIMKEYMKKYMNEEMLEHTQLTFAQLGNTAGMVGAYVYFQKKENYS